MVSGRSRTRGRDLLRLDGHSGALPQASSHVMIVVVMVVVMGVMVVVVMVMVVLLSER
jgi:hypothetical protein